MNPADFGSPPALVCAQGSGGADRITRNFYDAAGQRLQVREGVGTSIEAAEATWAYNLGGQVTTVIDGNGNRAVLRYDGHGRQDRWTFPPTTRATAYNDATQATALDTAGAVNAADYEEYSYDPNGNRTNLRKRDERNIAFAYDALNRATSKTYPQGGATAVYYSYDLRGLQLSARFTSQSGEGITSAWDGFGRLASSSTNMGGTTRTLSYQYDRNGARIRRIRITHPDRGSGQGQAGFGRLASSKRERGRRHPLKDLSRWRRHRGLFRRCLCGAAGAYEPYSAASASWLASSRCSIAWATPAISRAMASKPGPGVRRSASR